MEVSTFLRILDHKWNFIFMVKLYGWSFHLGNCSVLNSGGCPGSKDFVGKDFLFLPSVFIVAIFLHFTLRDHVLINLV